MLLTLQNRLDFVCLAVMKGAQQVSCHCRLKANQMYYHYSCSLSLVMETNIVLEDK